MPLRWSSTERFLSLAEHMIGSIAVAGASSHPPSPPRTSRQPQAPQSEEIGLIAFFRPTRRTFRLHRRLDESSIGQCTGSPQGCNQWRPTAGARWLTGDPTTHHLLGVSPQFFPSSVSALRAYPIGGKRIPRRCVSTASESYGTRPTRPLCKLQGVASARSYARANSKAKGSGSQRNSSIPSNRDIDEVAFLVIGKC